MKKASLCPKVTETDFAYMALALKEAWKAAGHTRPNPPVGAVVVSPAGCVLGKGYHHRCGADHAEVMALKDAAKKFGAERLAGSTVYVTLEPCSHPGRVGACTDALIAARVARVVWACNDPNPSNKGRAKRVLAQAGIAGELLKGMAKVAGAPGVCGPRSMAQEVTDLIAPFAKHVCTGLPYLTVKLALSLDGRICDDKGTARWISSAASRTATGHLRTLADCVLVGAETVRCDNPSLLCHEKRNADLYRAVVTASGVLPTDSNIFTDEAQSRTLLFIKAPKGNSKLPNLPNIHTFKFTSLRSVLRELGQLGFMHILCEGGLTLARVLAKEGLVDEWLTVLSPLVIGHQPLAQATRFTGSDTRVIYRSTSCSLV